MIKWSFKSHPDFGPQIFGIATIHGKVVTAGTSVCSSIPEEQARIEDYFKSLEENPKLLENC